MKFQNIALANLQPAKYNPRVRLRPGDPDYEKLRRSIETFGLVDPLIVNKSGIIIGGHQRFYVLSDMGTTHADCVVMDLSDAKEKSLNIALNRISGTWEEATLKNLLRELEAGSEIDATITGFSDAEIDALIKDIATIEAPVVVAERTGAVIDSSAYNPKARIPAEPNDVREEYVGMPEFVNENALGRKIIVHFKTEDDVQEFAELIGQTITEQTKFLWFPPVEEESGLAEGYE